MSSSGPADIGLRAVAAADAHFLRRLYAASRHELSLFGWSPPQMEAFLETQFSARERSYGEQFPGAADSIVLVGGEPAGRLLVARSGEEIRLVDIALVPEQRGGGIGTALIASLQAEAAAAGIPLALHVEAGNRAANLYRRLGFRLIAGDGVYQAMAWLPESAAVAGR